jgi:surfeit locus 1 family protein
MSAARKQIPLLTTALVVLAAATMVWLGVWQLHRKAWKEAMIARHEAAQALSSEVPWPQVPKDFDAALYRHSSLDCETVLGWKARGGRSASGESGWAHEAECRIPGGRALVAVGWSRDPEAPHWAGGPVTGIVSGSDEAIRLVAAPAQAGLAQLAIPDPRDVPNNHLAYAIQWFAFALTALVIYALALRKRWRSQAPDS